jgi:hypothetical protein
MISYNKKAMDIVRKLTDDSQMSSTIKFQKDEDGVYINTCNPSETIYYTFRAPKDHFDFKGDSCVFYDYKDFYQFLTSFNDPQMDMIDDEDKDTTFIELKEGNAIARYETADPECNVKTFNSIEYGEVCTELKLKESDIKKIKRMSSLIGSNDTNIKLKSNKDSQTMRLSLVTGANENSYSDVFECVVNEDINIEMPILAFNVLPIGDYTINTDDEDIVRFTLETGNDIKLEIFASEGE